MNGDLDMLRIQVRWLAGSLFALWVLVLIFMAHVFYG